MSIPNLNLNLKELAYGYHTKECSDNYSKGRPSYPKECNNFLKGLGLSNESLIVDLAAGTGKFTEIIAQEFNNIIAIEPSNTFRDECESLLKSIQVNNINPTLKYKVLNGLSTSIPLADNSVDCITVCWAWHWFSNIESVREISRVLKPNGVLVIIWHKLKFGGGQDSKNPIEFEKILRLHSDTKYHGGEGNISPTRSLRDKWRDVFDEIKNDSKLHHLLNPDLIELIPPLPNPQITNAEKTIASSLSQSYISILPPNEKQQFINQLKQNLDNFELTSNNKDFTVYYETQIFHTRKPLN
ncbi:hypothetical protein ACTFIZ_003787 [Dictyostelium cf. discoideum]